MGYLFPYQVQQIKHYQERLIPVKKSHPQPVASIIHTKNALNSNSSFNQQQNHSDKVTTSFQRIYADMTGKGKHVNERA